MVSGMCYIPLYIYPEQWPMDSIPSSKTMASPLLPATLLPPLPIQHRCACKYTHHIHTHTHTHTHTHEHAVQYRATDYNLNLA